MRASHVLLLIIFGSILMAAYEAFAQDARYCGSPMRNADGSIARSQTALTEFRRVHHCPSTGLKLGRCPGWAINHVIPLACGGCDIVSNMQWLPVDIKACAGAHCIDRFERKIYALDPPLPDTAACRNEVVK